MFFYNAYSLRNGYRSEYASLNMQLWRVTRPLDAAKEWRENPSAYFLERMTAIRAVGKDTLYVSSDPHLKLRWQMDRDSWERHQSEWYAPQVDCEFSFATAETLSCITKALKAAGKWTSLSPREIVELLKAKPVVQVKCYMAYALAPDDAPDQLAPYSWEQPVTA